MIVKKLTIGVTKITFLKKLQCGYWSTHWRSYVKVKVGHGTLLWRIF
jgi:hypothetical protein